MNALDPSQGVDVRTLVFSLLDRQGTQPFGWPYAQWPIVGFGLQLTMVCGRDDRGPWEIALTSRPGPLRVSWTSPSREGVARGPATLPVHTVALARRCPLGVPLGALCGDGRAPSVLSPSLSAMLMADIDADLNEVIAAEQPLWEPVSIEAVHVGVDGRARVLAVRGDVTVDGVDGVYARLARRQGAVEVAERVGAYRRAARLLLLVNDADWASRGDEDASCTDDRTGEHLVEGEDDTTEEHGDIGGDGGGGVATRADVAALVRAHLDPEIVAAHDVATDMAAVNRNLLMTLEIPHLRRLFAKR